MPDEERSSIILEYSALSNLNKALLKRVTSLYNTLLNFLCANEQKIKFKAISNAVKIAWEIPSGVEQKWYL
jgi:hypothetical protein